MNKIQSLESLKAFLKDRNDFISIIEMCNLEPIDSWKCWTDNMGNTISISVKNNKLSISKNNLKIKISDLFHKNHPKTLVAKSKQQLVLYKDNCVIIFLFGYDNRLRVTQYNSIWKVKSPLDYKISLLQKVVKTFLNNKIENFKEYQNAWLGINESKDEMILTNAFLENMLKEL